MKTKKQIVTNIDKIAGRAQTLRGLIQVTACDVACHILEHGEVSLAVKLLDAVGTGANYENLAKWFGEFAFCRMQEGVMVLAKKARQDVLKGFCNEADARASYEISVSMARAWHLDPDAKEKIAKVFDSFEAVDRLIATLLKKGDQQLAAKLRAVVTDYKTASTL